MFYNAPAFTFKNAKRLRSNLTRSENILWKRLSKNQLNNLRFKRQHPVGGFIVDFYCHKAKLVIEIDGPYHMNDDQVHYDKARTHELNLLGIKVIRFKNNQVVHNVEEVLDEIKKHLPAPKSPKED
jgi:very-short-patch-repair endonuclease